jgi:predicted kinase
MQHLLILVGISGSGKTTFAKQWVLDKPHYLRLNRDDLRRSLLPVPLGEYWTWDQKRKDRIERIVTDLEQAALRSALEGRWNVVLDNTHLKKRYISELLQLVESVATTERPIEVTFRVFDVPPDVAIARDRERGDSIGETAIRDQHERLRNFRKHFKLSQTFRFPIVHETPEPMPQDASLPQCILVDIDGTAAKIRDRSPFDWSNVSRDLPNIPVLNVVRAMRAAGCRVVFMSGRDSAARSETINWIRHHLDWEEPTDYELFMRRGHDDRKDAIIKRELFDAHIRGRYFVELVLDDRDQVVALWRRELGLTCLQVDYGNF